MVHNVSTVLWLQDPKVSVHIGHNAWVANPGINCLQDNEDPVGMEEWTLDRLTLLTLHGGGISYSLPRQLLKKKDIIKIAKLLQ